MNPTKKVKITTPKNALQMVMESAKIQVELETVKKKKQTETKQELPQEPQAMKSALKRSRSMFEDLKDGFLTRFLPQETQLELCDAYEEKFSDLQDSLSLLRLRNSKENNVQDLFQDDNEEEAKHQDENYIQYHDQEAIFEIQSTKEEEHNQEQVVDEPLVVIKKSVKKSYKTYDTDFKTAFIECYLQHGLTTACLLKKVDSGTASKWVRKFKDGGKENLEDKRGFNGLTPNDALEKYVYAKFIERRTKGLPMNYKILQSVALNCPNKPESFKASNGWVQNFMRRYKIVSRKKTHATSQIINEITALVMSYFDSLQEIHSWGKDSIVFLNFDETPLFFDFSSDYTLSMKGESEVKVLSHSSAKTRATFGPCVTSTGELLPPLYVFVYKYSEKSDRKVPIKYEAMQNQTKPFMIKFTSSDSNNDSIMDEYIRRVIKPWADERQVHPVLVFDEASCHLTPTVKKALIECNILPLFIPAGSTSILQPLDVCLNKLLKAGIRTHYLKWLEEKAKDTSSLILPPTIENILMWSQDSLQSLSEQSIKQSFDVTGISGSLSALKDQEILHSKLLTLFDEYLSKFNNDRIILEDEDPYLYADAVEKQLNNMMEENELNLEEEAPMGGKSPAKI